MLEITGLKFDTGFCVCVLLFFSVWKPRGPLQSSKDCRGWICLWKGQPVLGRFSGSVDKGVAGTSGRGSLSLAFLACLHCSVAAVLLALHVVESLSMVKVHLTRSSAVFSQVSRLMPNAFGDIFRMSSKRFFFSLHGNAFLAVARHRTVFFWQPLV